MMQPALGLKTFCGGENQMEGTTVLTSILCSEEREDRSSVIWNIVRRCWLMSVEQSEDGRRLFPLLAVPRPWERERVVADRVRVVGENTSLRRGSG